MENVAFDEMCACKKKLRVQIKQIISEKLNEVYRREKSKIATEQFLSSMLYKNASCICAYFALPSEIDTLEIIEHALADKKQVALPRVTDTTNSEMEFFFIDTKQKLYEQVVGGAYGLREPALSAKKFDAKQMAGETVFLVPGLAFSEKGERLGRGKGFYDKYFLRNGLCPESVPTNVSIYQHTQDKQNNSDAQNSHNAINIPKIGCCFPFQIVPSVYATTRDVCMTHILCDSFFAVS